MGERNGYSQAMRDLMQRLIGPNAAVFFTAALILLLADLLWSAEPPEGNREQGRRLFEEKGCIQCHVPPGKPKDIGPPLATLQRRQGLLQLAGRLWNHAPAMQEEFAKRGYSVPSCSAFARIFGAWSHTPVAQSSGLSYTVLRLRSGPTPAPSPKKA